MKYKIILILTISLFSSLFAHSQQTLPQDMCKRIKKIKKAIKAKSLPYEKDDKKKLALGTLLGEIMYQTTYKFFDSSAVYKMNRFNTKEWEYYAILKMDTSKTNVIKSCNDLQDAVEKCGFKRVGLNKGKPIDAKHTYALYSKKDLYIKIDLPYNAVAIKELGYTLYASRITFELR